LDSDKRACDVERRYDKGGDSTRLAASVGGLVGRLSVKFLSRVRSRIGEERRENTPRSYIKERLVECEHRARGGTTPGTTQIRGRGSGSPWELT